MLCSAHAYLININQASGMESSGILGFELDLNIHSNHSYLDAHSRYWKYFLIRFSLIWITWLLAFEPRCLAFSQSCVLCLLSSSASPPWRWLARRNIPPVPTVRSPLTSLTPHILAHVTVGHGTCGRWPMEPASCRNCFPHVHFP